MKNENNENIDADESASPSASGTEHNERAATSTGNNTKPPRRSSSSRYVPKGRKVFPLKLYDMLVACEKEGLGDVISWTKDGRGCEIRDQQKFESELQPRFFDGHNKLRSFYRQLNLWGFQRCSACRGQYTHPYFVKGDRDLVERCIKRVPKKSLPKKHDQTRGSSVPNSSRGPAEDGKQPARSMMMSAPRDLLKSRARSSSNHTTEGRSPVPAGVFTQNNTSDLYSSFRVIPHMERQSVQTGPGESRTVSPSGVSCLELFPDIATEAHEQVLANDETNDASLFRGAKLHSDSLLNDMEGSGRDATYYDIETREILEDTKGCIIPLALFYPTGNCLPPDDTRLFRTSSPPNEYNDANEPLCADECSNQYAHIEREECQKLLECLNTENAASSCNDTGFDDEGDVNGDEIIVAV